MRISDWSSDVCSSDLTVHHDDLVRKLHERETDIAIAVEVPRNAPVGSRWLGEGELVVLYREEDMPAAPSRLELADLKRSEEHTSELQSLMRISYAVFCLKKKKTPNSEAYKLYSNSDFKYQNSEQNLTT